MPRRLAAHIRVSPLRADSAEDVRKVCRDCPLLAPLNDTRVVHAAEAALAAFNARNNGSNFQLEEISRAQLVVKTEILLTGWAIRWHFGNVLHVVDREGGKNRCRGRDEKARRGLFGKGRKHPKGYQVPECHEDPQHPRFLPHAGPL